MTCIGIIPAKGFSQGLARKNLIDLGGKPLLVWTLEACFPVCSDVYVSTDDSEIATIAENLGAKVINRPYQLCEPTVHSVNVVLHAINRLSLSPDTLVGMFHPTSPFRTSADINGALRQLVTPFDSVVGVNAIGPVNSLRTINGNQALSHVSDHDFPFEAQRQDVPQTYCVNGAIYISSAANLVETQSYHQGVVSPYIMSKSSSLDINNKDDLQLARKMV